MNDPVIHFRRDISPNERLYLVGQRLSPPFAIQVFVEGHGDLDVKRLEGAVAEASRACPGARLVARGREWVDSGRPPPVREVDGSSFDGVHFDRTACLWQKLDPYQGPTCEVLVFKGQRTTIAFRAFHGVMDGKGVLLWMKDVFRVLRGEGPESATSRQTDLGLLKKLGPVGRRTDLKLDCPSPLGSARVTDTDFLWKRRTLPGGHPGLVAKLASIISGTAGPDRFSFMVPVDLRRHDADLFSTANLSLPIFLEARKGEGWEDLHERLLAALAGKRELSTDGTEGALSMLPLWGIRGVLHLVLKRQRDKGKYATSGILSHLGRVHLGDFSAGTFTASTVYSLPVHPAVAPLSLVAVECPGHVELTLACPRGDGMADRADRLLDRIQEALTRDDARHWAGNRSAAPFPDDKTVTRLFTEQVALTPDAVALVCGGREVTYGELDLRSNVIARELRDRSIGPGAIVGLLVDRTEGALTALWGVLKAGAAYLPIDPQVPEERIGYMLADSKASVCVIQKAYGSRLAAVFSGEVLVLEDVDYSTTPTPPVLEPAGGPRDLAYIIYTSGSTGRPKGVQIEHRSLVNYLHWARRAYQVDGNTRFALFTSLSFDLSVTSFFLPLISGGSVALFPEEVDHLTLRSVLERSGVDALKLTPTHLELIDRLGVIPSGFRTIIVGGEQLKSHVAARAQDMFGPRCRIINEYGPTETTVGCVYHVFDAARDGHAPAVPIGVPISNTTIHLMDQEQKPARPGEAGEVYIAGEGLARGYLDREDLNREKFVHLADGTRAYRSGDLARLRADGVLEYLGRTDDQIKIRGHRIEPGEIEAVLKEHGKVEQAVVLGRARPNHQDKILCAYVVARLPINEALDEVEIRAHLESRLPLHMVPSFFVAIEKIPLTVNGKVDVRALPDPFGVQTPSEGGLPVRDEVEGAIAVIWSQVLELPVEGIGSDANFYRLGGDSLKMVEMLSAVAGKVVGGGQEQAFMRSIRPVIRRPTLESVCQVVKAVRRPLAEQAA